MSEQGKLGLTVILTIVLIGAGLYFLYNSVSLITSDPPKVAASLLAAVIGLSLVSAGVTLFRTWIISSSFQKSRMEEV